MVRQLISSPLFSSRGLMSPQFMATLLVRGGGTRVDEALKKHGWNGVAPVITTVLTAEVTTGTIRGVRFETRGALEEIKFQANDLWVNSEVGITCTIKFTNLGILNWGTVGECRNQTTWVDSSNFAISFKRANYR